MIFANPISFKSTVLSVLLTLITEDKFSPKFPLTIGTSVYLHEFTRYGISCVLFKFCSTRRKENRHTRCSVRTQVLNLPRT